MSDEFATKAPLVPDQPSGLVNYAFHGDMPSKKTDIEKMSQEELLALHSEIEGKLTGTKLSEVNLTKETLIQFQKAKALQADASKKDTSVPMNQRAQVQNSIAGILASLAKTQMDLHDSEALKRLKSAVIRVVRTLPVPQQEQFFDMLEIEIETIKKEMDV